MPLVYQQNINEATRIAVWHITENEDFFCRKVMLSNAITHPHKRLQHLAGRYLLTELYDNFPLELIKIADTRKPFLADEAFHFSISHCGDYVAAIVSKVNRVGVDIEVISEKVQKIKDKFLSVEEQQMIGKILHLPASISHLQLLTLAWSIKETMFKWYGAGAIDFKEHLNLKEISLLENEFIAHCIFSKNGRVELKPHGLIFNNNFLTWLVT